MITTSDPRVTYIDLQWPTVTYSDLQWPTVTLRWPILTLHTSSYLYQPHLVHTGLNHGDLEKYGGRKVVVVVVATKFSVKHQGKDNHHPPSISINDLLVTFLGQPFTLPFPWASQKGHIYQRSYFHQIISVPNDLICLINDCQTH